MYNKFPFRKVQLILTCAIVIRMLVMLFPFRKVQLILPVRLRLPARANSVSIPQGTINTTGELSRIELITEFPFRKVQLIPGSGHKRQRHSRFPFRKVQLIPHHQFQKDP